MTTQVQCPHCKGYNVTNVTQSIVMPLTLLWSIGGAIFPLFWLLAIRDVSLILAFLVYGGGFVAIFLPFARRTRRLGVQYQCANPACGKKWTGISSAHQVD